MAKHFSHHHKLHPFESHAQAEAEPPVCSGCEAKINGSAYKCTEQNCGYFLHEKCFELPRQILHNSHPGHALTLFAVPTYPNGFQCNGCSLSGSAFVYHCDVPGCNYDLHVQCSNMPRTVVTRGHQHRLTLFESLPEEVANHGDLRCGVCGGDFPQGFWTYLCRECGYGEHLGCEFKVEEHRQTNDEQQHQQQQQHRQQGGDDDEMVLIRRSELNALRSLLKSKDSLIQSYQLWNFQLQNQLNLLRTRNLFRY